MVYGLSAYYYHYIYNIYYIYIFNFVTHGLFMKDDSFKEGVQLHPFHAHVLSIKKV